MENNLFVKINYKIKGTSSDVKCDTKINYIDCSNAHKYMIGGGFCSKDSCSFAFKARNLEEAKLIANNNPLIKNWLNKYGDIKGELVFVHGM